MRKLHRGQSERFYGEIEEYKYAYIQSSIPRYGKRENETERAKDRERKGRPT